MSYTAKRCSFCGRPVLLGNGIMYVRNDATTFWFCSTKCRKNSLSLRRDPRKLKWSRGVTRVGRSTSAQRSGVAPRSEKSSKSS